MNADAVHSLFSTTGAVSHPVTRITIGVTAIAIIAALAAGPVLLKKGLISPAVAADVRTRTITWAVIIPLVLVPMLAAPIGAMLLVGILSILCYREFARATGLFRERALSTVIATGILLVTFANIDHWPGMVDGVQAAILLAICIVSLLPDHPKGYIQRTALSAAAFMLFGIGLGRLGMLASDRDYRPILCSLMLTVQANDVAAYCVGRALGNGKFKGKWFPNTSPGKTIAGHVGAAIITTPVAAILYHLTFQNSPLDDWRLLAVMGLATSILGQLGDLVISSVKRDVGIKDMGALLPGHGGVLDRCNSLLLVAPAMFHTIEYFRGILPGVPVRAITGH